MLLFHQLKQPLENSLPYDMGLDNLMIDLGVEKANEAILFFLVFQVLIVCDVLKGNHLAFLLLPDEVMALNYQVLLIMTVSSVGSKKNVGLELLTLPT